MKRRAFIAGMIAAPVVASLPVPAAPVQIVPGGSQTIMWPKTLLWDAPAIRHVLAGNAVYQSLVPRAHDQAI